MEEFGLNLDNILSEEEILELTSSGENEKETEETSAPNETEETIENTENLSIDDLFGSESVGDGNHKEEENKDKKESTTTENSTGTSPNNLYSSIAQAFKVDGVFSVLDDEDISKVSSAEDFTELVDKLVETKLTEEQQRVSKALKAGVEPSQIQAYEQTIANLKSITDEAISDESDQGINLRKSLIISDFINKGYSQDKAEKLAQRSFDNNTDIEDAKDALEQNRTFFEGQYKTLLDEANKTAKQQKEKRQKEAEALRKSILEEDKAFGEIEVDKNTRQRVYDVINKPFFKDSEGNYFTELQKYEMDNHAEFMKKLGYLYVITDGFKSLDRVSKSIEKKVRNKGLKELEQTLNTTLRNPDGSLKFVSGVGDGESYMNSGWSIDTNN